MQSKFRWVILAIATATLCVSNGMSITGISVFDQSLLAEFGWDRGELKFRDMVTFALAGLIAPFAGVVIDRVGVRKVMIFGFALLTVAYWFYGALNSLGDLYIVHAMLGIVLVCAGLNVAVILVSTWFVDKRGTAIGITLVGTSLGGVIFPQLGTQLINSEGWRSAYDWEMVVPVVMLLLTIFVVRDRPDDGEVQPVEAATEAPDDYGYVEALKTPTFWALAIIAMTTFYTVLGAQAHLFLHMLDMGESRQTATNAVSALFTAALFGKFIFGFLADHINQKRVLQANLLVMLAGAICLAMLKPGLIWGAVVAFGFGWGGLYTLLQLTAINSFGLAAAGKILGTITILDALGGGLGIWLTGVLFESGGQSYAVPFGVFVGMLVTAMIASFWIRPTRTNPH